MKLFENQNIDQNIEGTGLRALDKVIEQLGGPLNPEKLIDAAIRQCQGMDNLVREGWNSPFSRQQSGVILELLHQFSVQSMMLRSLTKPLWFKLLSGKIEKATRGSAAFDLFASEDILIGDQPVPVPTGVHTDFSPNLVAIIKEKSGLSVNKGPTMDHPDGILQGLEVKAGVIDSDFRQEWKVVLRNPTQLEILNFDSLGMMMHRTFEPVRNWKPYQVTKGMKIAQVILVELPHVELIGEGITIKDEVRQGGFGSTGAS